MFYISKIQLHSSWSDHASPNSGSPAELEAWSWNILYATWCNAQKCFRLPHHSLGEDSLSPRIFVYLNDNFHSAEGDILIFAWSD